MFVYGLVCIISGEETHVLRSTCVSTVYGGEGEGCGAT